MKINDLLSKKTAWLQGKGPYSNIAISTRVRIARNVKGNIYFNRATDEQRAGTLNILFEAIKESGIIGQPTFFMVNDLSDVDRMLLVERHLMSRDHILQTDNKGVVIDDSEEISVMVNEEDHMRLQVLKSGLNIMESWQVIDGAEEKLAAHVEFDYSSRFGYLTSCPTNTGTGLRTSVMLHIPALVMTGQIYKVHEAISKLGLTMRGFYGEGTEALGDFFQMSNQVALGHSEMDILDNIERIIRKIIDKEQLCRDDLNKNRKQELSDTVFRSYGTLKSARIITSNETLKLLSSVRLGADLGILDGIDVNKLNEILLFTQPGHLQKISGKKIPQHERDIKRADVIRKEFGGGQ